jgi:hypothetical protein
MLKPIFGLVLGLTVCSAAVYVGKMSAPPVAAGCSDRDVLTAMLQLERPLMGPREREFWISLTIETAGKPEVRDQITPVILGSLLAQENKFRGQGVSRSGAVGAAQIMPEWRSKPECQGLSLEEIEPNVICGSRILAYEIRTRKGLVPGLRKYVASVNGESQAQWYADAVLARVSQAVAYGCPTMKTTLHPRQS